MNKLKTFIPIVIIAVIGGIVRKLSFIEFQVPPLVEGPKVVFFIPLPEFLQKMPFAMELANGGYGLPVTITVVTTWFLIFFMFMLFRIGTSKLEVIPGKLQLILESIYAFLDGVVEQMMGSWKKKYLSYIGPLFLFIFTSNIISFFPIPWFSLSDGHISFAPAFRTPTSDLNTTVGLALLTTFMFLKASIKSNGVLGYFKGFLAPIPIMLPLNIVGEFAKPVNISVRLFGNAFAGGVIMGLLYMGAPAVVPAALHLYFDLFSGLVQSFVFIMLSMVYIQGSLGDSEYTE
ncbi:MULTISPECIES: F0F1 ATP synthase subunit A [unclassified Fusobacterium]|uniref:F0F1 ATP synthase subunit A n=1 Tax=unclassified Fusobacterium TaxID=2648384 RepID=UPI0025BB4FF6|nr:F0F1 ATP synthase subunit A [Fusobacterium sp.]